MNPSRSIALQVLVVDDSAVVREVLTAVLAQEPGFQVTVAADPLIAMGKMKVQRPDVIILDLAMPRMDGLTFLQKIAREDPIPVIICSALTGPETGIGLQALEEGAIEVITKPRLGVRDFLHESAVLLIDAVRAAALAGTKAALHRSVNGITSSSADGATAEAPSKLKIPSVKIVAIGASTGGTEALRIILEQLPPDSPGLVVVQHMPEGFTAAFAQRLNQSCAIEVKEAAGGDPIVTGRALIAPGNLHIGVRRRGGQYVVDISDGPLISRHRPSVDKLFSSVAEHAGANAIGVILTGMGNDGAAGLLKMKQAGAATIAQDEASCVVFGMPKEAVARGAADRVVRLDRIAEAILQATKNQPAGAPNPLLSDTITHVETG